VGEAGALALLEHEAHAPRSRPSEPLSATIVVPDMHLPPPSPPIRGFLLRLLSRLTAIGPIRRLILIKLRQDTGISRLPELDR
jgi:hypothetical protein